MEAAGRVGHGPPRPYGAKYRRMAGAAGLLALLVLNLGSARAFCHVGALGLAQPHRGALQARSLRPRASPGLRRAPGGLHRLQASAPAGQGEERVGPVKLQTAYLIAGGATALAWLGCALAALATYKPWRYTHNTIGVLQALTALPLIWASFYGLATASREGIFRLRLPDCRRLNVRVYLCAISIWARAWPANSLSPSVTTPARARSSLHMERNHGLVLASFHISTGAHSGPRRLSTSTPSGGSAHASVRRCAVPQHLARVCHGSVFGPHILGRARLHVASRQI